MQRLWLILCGLLLIGGGLFAQQPPAQPNAEQVRDAVLDRWEKTMTGLQSLKVECSCKKIDKTFNTTEVKKGTAMLLKGVAPNQPCRASLYMVKFVDDRERGVYNVKTNEYEKFICSGDFLYEYVPSEKVIRIHKMQGPVADNFLSFLIGMKAADAKKRYNIRWVGHDNWYHYLQILPRENNQADFSEAQLTLTKKDFLPRRLWYKEPNGNEITWDCPEVSTNNPGVQAQAFQKPTPDPGWRFSQVPANAPPRVIRPAP